MWRFTHASSHGSIVRSASASAAGDILFRLEYSVRRGFFGVSEVREGDVPGDESERDNCFVFGLGVTELAGAFRFRRLNGRFFWALPCAVSADCDAKSCVSGSVVDFVLLSFEYFFFLD